MKMKYFMICLTMVSVAASSVVFAATGTSTAVAIDLSDSSVLIAPAAIGYSPFWNGAATNSGALVEIVAVYHKGQYAATSNVLYTGAADESGVYALQLPSDGVRTFTLIHRTMLNSAVIGAFTNEVAIGEVSMASAEAFADTTAAKLDRIAATEKDAAVLAVSDSWVEGAASVVIEHVETPLSGQVRVSELYRGAVPVSETFVFVPKGRKHSVCRCLLHFLDSEGVEIGEPLMADYTGRLAAGMVITFL